MVDTMLDNDKKVEIYKELLKLYGWPKWPPTEIPEDRPWWKDNIHILPDSKSIRIPEPLIFVELNGLSSSGKSTIEEETIIAIKKNLKKKGLQHVQVASFFDPVVSTEHVIQDLTFANFIEEDFIPPVLLKDEWETSFLLQINKSIFWSNFINKPERYIDVKVPNIVLVNRGPTDALIWAYTIWTHEGDSNFEIPERVKKVMGEIMLDTTATFQNLSLKTNAKIFVGIDQRIAQERRKNAGKKHKGWVTDSPIFKDYSSWANYWIKSVYPTQKLVKGSGLLTVDGELPNKSKIKLISRYVTESASRLLPSH